MPSKTSKTEKPQLQLKNKQIYIVGPQRLHNEMLSRILQQETGALSQCVDDFGHIPLVEEKEESKDRLVPMDCMVKGLNKILSLF